MENNEKNPLLRFTEPMARDRLRLTREQIMSIPDRAVRRAAIAENIKLFEGDRYHG